MQHRGGRVGHARDLDVESNAFVVDDVELAIQGDIEVTSQEILSFLLRLIQKVLVVADTKDRVSYKVPIHGINLKKFYDVQMPYEVMGIFVDVGMLLLVDCSFTMLDALLLSTFVER
ncbi:hypothetical protein KIW84_035967 [Lathyrus oleraceus]|uniref:Uncharacterized protein n=1 Tax=Pisum sativum TaxID=3888 RepID=A0A9D4Y5C5_PEA|nr:hypothetical protein KIW84_035967 [Pisum sativum]